MQKSSWHRGQSFLVQPKPGLDPKTTISELFATGPMRLVLTKGPDQAAVLEAQLPESLEVTTDAESADQNTDNRQKDLFADESSTFDHFLHEESKRVKCEAETIQDLKEKRIRQIGD